jgi:predicted ATP-dependent serine protease
LKEDKFPFDLEKFNEITKGGVSRKTLNIILAGTGVGKSLAMCHFASAALAQGQNVLYITLEMAEEKIAERIDANLFDIDIQDIENMPKQTFDNKVQKIQSKTNGKLIIKEYPTAAAHTGHFRALLDELKLKKDFKPDVIFIDYLNIAASSRMKGLGGSINTYSYIKAIAEELRGLAVEFNLPIWSATQVTRTGFGNTDVEITDTSESFGLPATADLMLALISTEQLEGMNQLMVKQLKNRYNDPTQNKRFIVGIDRAKMRLYDVEDSAQTLSNENQSQQIESDYSSFKI